MTARERRLQELYRLSEADYDIILAFQGGVCPITGLPASSNKMNVDHRHDSGLVFGIINWRANKALGMFQDNPKLLRAAADYLEGIPPATAALGAPRYGLIGRAKQGKRKPIYGPPQENTESEQ